MGSAGTIQEEKLEAPARLSPPDDALVVYILNVGDGDSIVLQFPDAGQGRAYAVVDCNDGEKTVDLLENELAVTYLRFVCATHPHSDHICGLNKVLRDFSEQGRRIEEFWDSGFRFTSTTYNGIITTVRDRHVRLLRPTSGFEDFINGVRITVLSPSIMLRNRYDTYGVDANNASIVLRLEYPVPPPSSDYPKADDLEPVASEPRTRSVILGGDAHTDAWSRVLEEFPHLDKDDTNWARQIGVRKGRQPLSCDVLKVAHHCSKHGVNLELVERMGDRSGAGPSFGPECLIASCAGVSRHGFPHDVAQEILREVRDPQATAGASHKPDYDLGIHYTAQMIDGVGPLRPAGSVAVVLHGDGSARPDIYRLCDAENESVDLAKARRVMRTMPPDA